MTIEIWGRRRNGKSRMGAILATYLSLISECPLFSTDKRMIETGLAQKETQETFKNTRSAIHYLPELWRQIDSRKFKENVFITQFWQLQGHQDIVIIYDTQLRSQMDLRIRETNDYSVYCKKIKTKEGYIFDYSFFDPYDWKLLKKIRLKDVDMHFIDNYYDSVGETVLIE